MILRRISYFLTETFSVIGAVAGLALIGLVYFTLIAVAAVAVFVFMNLVGLLLHMLV